MVEGRIEKYYKEVCLMEQSFIRDPDIVIKDLVVQKIAAIGEKIAIRRFARYELGEGIEKRQDNFADEVMKEINR
jgi:elongation factor Ts